MRLILPSDLQAQMARAILLAEGMAPQAADRVVRSFHAFATDVASAVKEVRLVPAHLRRWLLQQAVQAVAQPGTLMERVLRREGILTLLSTWVREMTREGVSPESLEQPRRTITGTGENLCACADTTPLPLPAHRARLA
ncbi:hypothetical protein HRbin16_00365 [bacterium HR16]|nr:hypothetical protein HRbin16_00365 [bacterium HR16]